jgi:hypothetical protein
MDLKLQSARRGAYLAFAEELFRCDDYEGARKVLRHETDAAWRSDALTAVSDRARRNTPKTGGKSNSGVAIMAASLQEPPTTAPSTAFGKSLDFKSNYYRP